MYHNTNVTLLVDDFKDETCGGHGSFFLGLMLIALCESYARAF